MNDLMQREQLKREQTWDASQRWSVLLETIAWAEAQPTVRRNTPERCIAEEARKFHARAAMPG